MSNSGEWKSLVRQNSSASGSGPIDVSNAESAANKKEEKSFSSDRSPSNDMSTKSDSDLNEMCTNDKPIKKESVIS